VISGLDLMFECLFLALFFRWRILVYVGVNDGQYKQAVREDYVLINGIFSFLIMWV